MTMTTPSTKTMEDNSNAAATAWTLELGRAGNEISQAARHLQAVFHDASEKAVEKGDEPIPDPVKLLRRLAALESRIDQLRKDCVEVAESKQEMALAVSDIQLKNAHMLRKISDSTKNVGATVDNQEDAITQSLEDNWVSLASTIEEQHELLSMHAKEYS